MSLRILVVDDEKIIRLTTTRQLIEAGYEAEAYEGPFPALAALDRGAWDVVLTDLRMASMDGLQFLRQIKSQNAKTVVMLMTAYGTVGTAVQAMRDGAYDFLTKPFSFQELKVRLERVEQDLKMRQELHALRESSASAESYCGLIGVSPQMRRVFELIEQFAGNPSNVLLLGETGTGKELAARALHMRSPRAKGPFVTVSCGALLRELDGAELFGGDPQSPEGAPAARPQAAGFTRIYRGRMEPAHGGTLFLDDISDLPLDIQPRLLRVLEEKQPERSDPEGAPKADVRVIAASKEDLEALVQQKKFREDLYYRLKVLSLTIPPLRERREDILFLARHFLSSISTARGTSKQLSDAAAKRLMVHTWPGNVRELRHAIEYAVAVSGGPVIETGDLPSDMQTAAASAPYTLNLDFQERINFNALAERFERDLIYWALRQSNGNQGKAAELLGIPRTTLQSKLVVEKNAAADQS